MRYPSFRHLDARMRTFERWNNLMDPTELAQSGFFYLGGIDQVQCFHCGEKLHSWKITDIADFEHINYSPGCSFIRNKTANMHRFSSDMLINMLEMIQDQTKRINVLESDIKRVTYEAIRNTIQDTVDKNDSFVVECPMAQVVADE